MIVEVAVYKQQWSIRKEIYSWCVNNSKIIKVIPTTTGSACSLYSYDCCHFLFPSFECPLNSLACGHERGYVNQNIRQTLFPHLYCSQVSAHPPLKSPWVFLFPPPWKSPGGISWSLSSSDLAFLRFMIQLFVSHLVRQIFTSAAGVVGDGTFMLPEACANKVTECPGQKWAEWSPQLCNVLVLWIPNSLCEWQVSPDLWCLSLFRLL